jgi:hypothetical protein
LVTAGPLSDYIVKVLARRNEGIREAEMRLPALIPFGICLVVSMSVAGVALQKQWPWADLVVVGFGFGAIVCVTIPAIAVAYAIDCYKPISGEIMVVVSALQVLSRSLRGHAQRYH